MSLLHLSVLILCLSFLIVAIAAVPFLLQMWRTIRSLDTTLQTLNKTLPGILENLEAITLNLSHATRTIDVQTQKMALVIDRTSVALGILWNFKSALLRGVRLPLVQKIRTARAIGKGLRTFFAVLGERH